MALGFITSDLPRGRLAHSERCPDTRKTDVLLGRDVFAIHVLNVWHGARVDTRRIYSASSILPSHAVILVQEASMALLPVRLVLLRQHSQFRVHLVSPLELGPIRGLLLFITWIPCFCRDHMEEQSRFPRL